MISEKDFVIKNQAITIENGSFQWSAPSNIALVKYWGKKENQIPANPSISFTLNNCKTITKLSFTKKLNNNNKSNEKLLLFNFLVKLNFVIVLQLFNVKLIDGFAGI